MTASPTAPRLGSIHSPTCVCKCNMSNESREIVHWIYEHWRCSQSLAVIGQDYRDET